MVIFPSGFTVVLKPGGSLWDTTSTALAGFVETGAFTSTGTAGQTLDCVASYE